ncbi:MAG: two pore domain potassium channel family protein [Planctomycetes bacterium]|nr:two pore domain potassium channel family protein [Planctomycetota bacterium]
MWIVGTLISLAFIILPLIDAFESIVQPRRVTHRFRYTRLYFRGTWTAWRTVAMWIPAGNRRAAFLSTFGPLSLLGLLATWVFGLIFGFALLHFSLATDLRPREEPGTLSTYLYLSGTTFFTLGYGDITPMRPLGRALAVIEAGLGFWYLAIIIGYLPVFYQAYSRREVMISLLDARAGSPPTAAELLKRLGQSGNIAAIDSLLADWETWAAELLESHLSFPVLSYYRSQHDNQSWLATLTMILDVCSLLLTEVKGANLYQAQVTFAMARHAAVDLVLVLKAPPREMDNDRLPRNLQQQLYKDLVAAGLELRETPACSTRLTELRGMYEPFVHALCRRVMFSLPQFTHDQPIVDNWQRSAWLKRAPGIGSLPSVNSNDDHFG